MMWEVIKEEIRRKKYLKNLRANVEELNKVLKDLNCEVEEGSCIEYRASVCINWYDALVKNALDYTSEAIRTIKNF